MKCALNLLFLTHLIWIKLVAGETESETSRCILGDRVFHENRHKDAVLFLWTQRNYIQACRKAVLAVPEYVPYKTSCTKQYHGAVRAQWHEKVSSWLVIPGCRQHGTLPSLS